MVDAGSQVLFWLADLLARFAGPIALAVGGYWAWVLFKRFRASGDPSLRKSTSSGVGSMSMLVSGVYVSILLAGSIAVVLWLAGSLSPMLAALLFGGVVTHAALEKREDMGGEPVFAGGGMDDD